MVVATRNRKGSKPATGQTGPKLTVLQQQQVMALVAKLHNRGWTQWDIAQDVQATLGLKISQPMVGQYLTKISDNYRQETKRERQQEVERKLEQYRDVRQEAWLAYIRSHKDSDKLVEEWGTVHEQGQYGDYKSSEALMKKITTREGRLPENAYLSTIMATLKAERDLLGLDEEVNSRVAAIEDLRAVIAVVLQAQREALADMPEVLYRLQKRTVELIPPEYLNAMNRPLRITDSKGEVDVGGG